MPETDDHEGGRRRRLDGYTLVERLGHGSTGAVFLAVQESLGRQVALKVLAPRLARNEGFVRRFFREARAAARLSHPNIITAIDVGEAQGYKYFVMEYAGGPTVSRLLSRGGALDEQRAVGIVSQVARALDHAAKNGFVHRDIKPANIILTADGTAKLLDLGLAKEVEASTGDTEQGQTMGTPDYISPEQARGDEQVDIRSDLYSLGATFFHMVTGRVPFPGANPTVVMTKHLTEAAPDPRELNPAIRPATARAIRKMMAKEPRERFQTAAELLRTLEAIEEGRDGPTGPTGLPRLRRRRGRGRRRRR